MEIYHIYGIPPIPMGSIVCMTQGVGIVHAIIELVSSSLSWPCVKDFVAFKRVMNFSDGIEV